MRRRAVAVLAALLVLAVGCAPVAFVQSDAFLDSSAVKSIHIMPLVFEITLDSAVTTPRADLQAGLRETRRNIGETLEHELLRRGYSISGHSEAYHQLDGQRHTDALLRAAVREFVRHHGRYTEDGADLFGDAFAHALRNVETAAVDEHGNPVKVKPLGGRKDARPQVDPLVTKTLAAAEALADGTDTALFLEMKSFIAPRRWFGRLREDSTLKVRVQLVSIREKKVIFTYGPSYSGADILHWRSVQRALGAVLARIPVKLE